MDSLRRFVLSAREKLCFLVLVFLSMYVLNAIGDMEALQHWFGGRRYLNVLWILTALYLLVSKFNVDREFFIQKIILLVPIGAVCFFLYIYHGKSFNLDFLKYAVLLALTASIVRRLEWFNKKIFFRINSAACLIVFVAALCQLQWLHRPIPDGDINQNVFASQAMIIGGISFFALLYSEVNKKERLFHALCGVLALWVALRTSCRTAYMAEMALAGLFYVLAYRKYRWSFSWILLGMSAVAVAMVVSVLLSPSVVEQKFGRISTEIMAFLDLQPGKTTSSSVGLRLAMWQMALTEIIPKYFWFGVGEVSKVDFVSLLPDTKVNKDFLAILLHFHNEGINIFVTGGLLLFVAANFLLYQLYRAARTEPVLLCILLGTLVFGMTEVTWLHKKCFLLLTSVWLLYECAAGNIPEKRTNETGAVSGKTSWR